jgi:hypothetical protein
MLSPSYRRYRNGVGTTALLTCRHLPVVLADEQSACVFGGVSFVCHFLVVIIQNCVLKGKKSEKHDVGFCNLRAQWSLGGFRWVIVCRLESAVGLDMSCRLAGRQRLLLVDAPHSIQLIQSSQVTIIVSRILRENIMTFYEHLKLDDTFFILSYYCRLMKINRRWQRILDWTPRLVSCRFIGMKIKKCH